MSKEFDQMIEDGEIYRKRDCDRCGVPGYDKMKGWIKEDWRDPVPDFGSVSSHFSISIPGYGYATLCQPCAIELKNICMEFMRQSTIKVEARP